MLVAVGLVCFVAKRAFYFPHIHPHRGDGQFQDISQRLGPIAISGYGIRMDEFDMSEPFDAEYRFGSMTNIERATYLYLGVHDEFGPAADCFKGDQNTTLCLELADSKGVTLLKAEGPLADFILQVVRRSRYYQLNHVRFARTKTWNMSFGFRTVQVILARAFEGTSMLSAVATYDSMSEQFTRRVMSPDGMAAVIGQSSHVEDASLCGHLAPGRVGRLEDDPRGPPRVPKSL